MNWITEDSFEIGGRVYHSYNPQWIKNLFKGLENDNDSPKDQEASWTSQDPIRLYCQESKC